MGSERTRGHARRGEGGSGVLNKKRSAGCLAKWDCQSSPAGTNLKNASEALERERKGRKEGECVKEEREGKKGRRDGEGSERGESSSLEST